MSWRPLGSGLHRDWATLGRRQNSRVAQVGWQVPGAHRNIRRTMASSEHIPVGHFAEVLDRCVAENADRVACHPQRPNWRHRFGKCRTRRTLGRLCVPLRRSRKRLRSPLQPSHRRVLLVGCCCHCTLSRSSRRWPGYPYHRPLARPIVRERPWRAGNKLSRLVFDASSCLSAIQWASAARVCRAPDTSAAATAGAALPQLLRI